MRRILVPVLFALALPLAAEGPAETQAQTVGTQHINFAPGGVIRWISSYGDLYIEGWDRPEVEVTVIKSTNYYDISEVEKESGRLETIQATVDRRSDSELAISTMLHKRADWAPPLRSRSKNKVTLEYRIYVPRNSHLVIDHRGGMVTAGNITGDIEATNRDGDIMLLLPAEGTYAIDAQSRMGHIASDFPGQTLSRYLVGQRFVAQGSSSSHHMHLRTGFGGITILSLPAEGEKLASTGGQVQEAAR